MVQFLPASSLPVFLKGLSAHGELHGPVTTDDGVVAFRRLESPADLLLDARSALIPPKKYLLPPRETILTCDASGYHAAESAKIELILLGLHPCDLAGIGYLDQVFLSDRPDPFYAARRRAITLVGFSCTPDEYCFCGSIRSTRRPPFDLFFEDHGDGYRVSAGSDRGTTLLGTASHLMIGREPPEAVPCHCPEEEAIHEAAARGETFPNSPLWEEFAARCLSCGACSLCCPTCYCFDVREYGGTEKEASVRLREWDNCLFRDHGEIAGGHNFRPTRIDRFHYRFQHKYLGFGPTRGIVSCVGCGRCREVCPVKIDILRLFFQEPSSDRSVRECDETRCGQDS